MPESVTDWELGLALSEKSSDAVSIAVVDGLKVRVATQLAPAFTGAEVEQEDEIRMKSAALAPETCGLLLKNSDPVPIFCRVTIICAPVTPCGTVPKDTLAGRFTMGVVPVPVNGTLCAPGDALSEKFNVAFSTPTIEGLNVRVTVQEPPVETMVAGEQVLDAMAKSAAFGPETEGFPVKESGALPPFIKVTGIAALVVPSSICPKERLAGRLTPGAVPVPVRVTVWVAGVALSAKVSVALSEEPVDGLKVMET